MRLIRFLARAFHNNAIVEPGTEMLVDDNTVLSAHMVDVAAESARMAGGGAPTEYQPLDTSGPVFRRDLAHSAAMPVDAPVTFGGEMETLKAEAEAALARLKAAVESEVAAVPAQEMPPPEPVVAADAPAEAPSATTPPTDGIPPSGG